MKEKQQAEEGKQPRAQAAMIPDSLVLTVLWMVWQVLLVAQQPSFTRMRGKTHSMKPTCTAPD